MRRILVSAALLLGLIFSNLALNENTKAIALAFSPQYHALSSEELRRAYQEEYGSSSRAGTRGMRTSDDYVNNIIRDREQTIEALGMLVIDSRHYERYYDVQVKPLEEKIIRVANIVYMFLYGIIGVFLLYSLRKWVSGGGLRPASNLMVKLTSRTTKGGAKFFSFVGFSGWRIKAVEKEFNAVKNLYDNGLVSEHEYLRKKAELTKKLNVDNG